MKNVFRKISQNWPGKIDNRVLFSKVAGLKAQVCTFTKNECMEGVCPRICKVFQSTFFNRTPASGCICRSLCLIIEKLLAVKPY